MINKDGHEVFTIALVAYNLGISAETIRRWERKKLIEPAYSVLGYRLYSQANIETLERIIKQHQKKRGVKK